MRLSSANVGCYGFVDLVQAIMNAYTLSVDLTASFAEGEIRECCQHLAATDG